jgi:4-amino-4-deoxy-L-arabinose transferase-like glycosyltransferase
MIKALQNNPILSIFILVIVMLGFSIEYIPVSIMEARNFITAREMITDGNWLLTTMNGVARYEKPPLPTWLTAVFGLVFGLKNIIVLRFPAIICVALIGVFTYLLSNRLLQNKLHSIYNALIVITSFYVIGIIIEAPWDIFTHGFMLIAIYYLFDLFQGNNLLKNSLLAGCFIGFSILCKGPISIYALLLPFIIAYGFIFKFQISNTKALSYLNCIFIALLVGGWWYLYVRFIDPETFKLITEKETGNWASYNVKPFYYYWSFFTQSGIWTIPAFISLLYPYLKSRVSNLKAYQLSLLWTLIAVILLSVIPEKKSRYLMPVLIPLAINTGFYLEYLIRSFKTLNRKRDILPVYFNFGLIAAIGIAFPFGGFFISPFLTGIILFWFILASLALVTISIYIIIQLKKRNMQSVFYLCTGFIITILITVVPLIQLQGTSNYNPISNLKVETSQKGLKVYSLNYIAPELIWQYGDKIPTIKDEQRFITFPTEDQFGLLANSLSLEELAELKEKYKIEKKESFDLNTSDSNSKKYNDRLTSDFYILTKL